VRFTVEDCDDFSSLHYPQISHWPRRPTDYYDGDTGTGLIKDGMRISKGEHLKVLWVIGYG
jgi:hypothetical protein